MKSIQNFGQVGHVLLVICSSHNDVIQLAHHPGKTMEYIAGPWFIGKAAAEATPKGSQLKRYNPDDDDDDDGTLLLKL